MSYDVSNWPSPMRDAAAALHALEPHLLRRDGLQWQVDWSRSRKLHHARIPATVAFLSALDPTTAAFYFAGAPYSLTSILAHVPSIDVGEIRALAALGGFTRPRSRQEARRTFFETVARVIDRNGLQGVFERVGGFVQYQLSQPMSEIARPKGIPGTAQIMLVTLCSLYNSDLACETFKRRWNISAVSAVTQIETSLAEREDFYRLIAHYAGW